MACNCDSNEPLTIKIMYHDEGLPKLEKFQVGDWIDLRSAEDIFIPKGEFRYISLGVSMELPNGFEAHIVPRSSLLKNHGVICGNSIGIIDNSYNGPNDVWKFCAVGLKNAYIKKGERICQFRIIKNQPSIKFIEVNELSNDDRGGIGSTGRN